MVKAKAALAWVGIDRSKYSGHSFRIGAATTAAQAGIGGATIKAMGKWSLCPTVKKALSRENMET